jgi:plasmid stabilization system protein ParE
MSHLIWSPRAVRDIARLHQFLAPKAPRTADRAIVTIRAAVQILSDFPDLGRFAPDSSLGHRELLVPFSDGGYVVTCVRRDDIVEILDIRHQREAGY